jgi:hypothetical protein
MEKEKDNGDDDQSGGSFGDTSAYPCCVFGLRVLNFCSLGSAGAK